MSIRCVSATVLILIALQHHLIITFHIFGIVGQNRRVDLLRFSATLSFSLLSALNISNASRSRSFRIYSLLSITHKIVLLLKKLL